VILGILGKLENEFVSARIRRRCIQPQAESGLFAHQVSRSRKYGHSQTLESFKSGCPRTTTFIKSALEFMKIYRVIHDVNTYQTFIPADESVYDTDTLRFEGKSKIESWKDLEVVTLNPLKPKSNFPYLAAGTIVCDQLALDKLYKYFVMAGEMLPIVNEGKIYYALNVLECTNMLNQEETEWEISPDNSAKLWINKFSFHPDRVLESTLFKIPETYRGDVLTYADAIDPEDEFYFEYQKSGLKGLLFERLWSDDE
jgi:hypothetical protein